MTGLLHRRPMRPVWLPASLLWLPTLLFGIVLMLGIDFDINAVGDAWRVRSEVPLGGAWVDEPVRFWAGAVITLLGIVAFALAAWRPDPGRLPLIVASYPLYRLAAAAFLVAMAWAWWSVSGHAFDASGGGIQWRFLLEERTSIANRVTVGVLGALALGFYVLSFGSPWGHASRAPQARADDGGQQA